MNGAEILVRLEDVEEGDGGAWGERIREEREYSLVTK